MSYLALCVGGTRVNPLKAITGLEWKDPGSEWSLFARHHGVDVADLDGNPLTRNEPLWSRAVNGLLLQRLYGGHVRHWQRGGSNILEAQEMLQLRELSTTRGPLRPIIWCGHSHGGNSIFCALADERVSEYPEVFRPAAVISLDMPVSRLMTDCYAKAREMNPDLPIIHVHSTGLGWHSRFRWLGSHFNDEALSIATHNIAIKGGHSRFLRDPQWLGQWVGLWQKILEVIEGREHERE